MQSVGATLVKLIATATSGFVSFTTNVIRPVKVTCEFSPVQAEGTPSPDNPLPISGWTECQVGNRGKNYFDYSKWDTIAKINAAGSTTYKPIAVPVPNGTYTVHSKFFNDSSKFGFYANIGKNASEKGTPDVNASQWMKHDGSAAYRNNTVTVNVTGGYIYINMYKANANALTWLSGLQVEAGSLATDYEEYKAPQTIPITFTNPSTGDPMTIYGGTVTLNSDGSVDVISTMGNIASYDGETLPGAWISSMDVYAEGATPTTGAQVVYELETPQAYHFDNIGQLQSFLGTNNIWHDMNGDITVEYWDKQ